MELKMMFYLSNVAIAVNISQPSVRIGGDLHALIDIFFLHGGSKSAKPFWDLKKNLKTRITVVNTDPTEDFPNFNLKLKMVT